jgi:predicted phosphoribosyltransferase
MLKLDHFEPWSPPPMGFLDRADAGRRLGADLLSRHPENPLVLALPRGGVEVGFQIALALHAPLDVLPARKLGAPYQPELAIGAIAPGAVTLNYHIIAQLGLTQDDIDEVIAQEEQELERRVQLFRSGLPPLDVAGKTVILVDDGLATGATANAAILSIRKGSPRKLILAVPVGAGETVAALSPLVDDLICLETPLEFRAVGEWYDDFEQTTDQRVIVLLRQAAILRQGSEGE